VLNLVFQNFNCVGEETEIFYYEGFITSCLVVEAQEINFLFAVVAGG
jgi:hypothetical protein